MESANTGLPSHESMETTMIDVAKAPYGALLLRVSMGVLFLLHGVYLKAFVYGMAGTEKFFATMGLPGWFAWAVMLYETIGGLALILGIYVRWIALFLGAHLLVVAWLAHAGNGWLFTNQGGGYEFPLFWAIACFTLALLGAGAHALVSEGRSEKFR
jgi:putative oxidoreductase